MKNQNNELTVAKKAAIDAAKNEAQFSAKSLLEEFIVPIKNYYFAETEFNDDELNISFLNGQKFRITAKEVRSV